jgi:hypothetical protein
MLTRIFAGLFAMLLAAAAPSLAFSKDEKSLNECGNYLKNRSGKFESKLNGLGGAA